MHDTKNLILAIVLSSVIMFTWQAFYVEPKQQEYRKAAKIALDNDPKNNVSVDNVEIVSPALVDRAEIVNEAGRIKINNGKLHGSISLKGARIDDLTLVDYKVANEPDAGEVVLLSPTGSKSVYFAESGWVAANNSTATPNAKTIWYTESTELTENTPVILSWDNNSGLKFFITIEVDENYMFKITKRVENYGNKVESLFPYGILNRTRDSEAESFFILHEGALAVLDGVLMEHTYGGLQSDKRIRDSNSKGWLGLTDKYWLTAFVPDQANSFDTNFKYFNRNNQDRYQVDYLGQQYDIESNKTIEVTSHLFTGPKKVTMLDDYGQQLGIELFDRAVDFGWLYFITKPIFKLLHYFNNVMGNFGLAILMLTVLLKILLFPLANKSYVSMHHLKRLQPKVMEIKEKYESDKVQMNKAVMELYKNEKVNPMAGCLPLILQIPIFFALYKVLFVTIEMRHAPFYGWITDLSAPDPTTIFNLFGLLPIDPPQFLMIGVWPLIMGFTMILQQQLNPKPADPAQAKVMAMLPYIFILLFATFPAGLIIYWAWNNVLSILQQWVITRRLPD